MFHVWFVFVCFLLFFSVVNSFSFLCTATASLPMDSYQNPDTGISSGIPLPPEPNPSPRQTSTRTPQWRRVTSHFPWYPCPPWRHQEWLPPLLRLRWYWWRRWSWWWLCSLALWWSACVLGTGWRMWRPSAGWTFPPAENRTLDCCSCCIWSVRPSRLNKTCVFFLRLSLTKKRNESSSFFPDTGGQQMEL